MTKRTYIRVSLGLGPRGIRVHVHHCGEEWLQGDIMTRAESNDLTS